MSGTKHDEGKNRLELVPAELIEEVGKVLTFGAKKYGDDNWREGISYKRVFGALMRHLIAFRKREFIDEESGLSHLAHAACNIAMLLTYESNGLYTEFHDLI